MIKSLTPDKFIFIVGETSYGLCCADDIAALHLKADLIVRIGDSCLTKNKQLPVYFFYKNVFIDDDLLTEQLIKLENENEGKQILIFYDQIYSQSFSQLSKKQNLHHIKISLIPYSPESYENENFNPEEDFIIYNRIFKKVRCISKENIILYYGNEDDKLLCELSLRYINSNKILFLDSTNNEKSYTEVTDNNIRKIYYQRFNLMQRAKESEVFGIIIGSLSISGLNLILEELKSTLRKNNKKFYSFLLGKITLEKLSNFVDYIDCFILVACPFNDFYNFKTLMKPMVCPLDIEIAFNEQYFKWNLCYTFDTDYILSKCKDEFINHIEVQLSNEIKDPNLIGDLENKFTTGLLLKDSEKNQALSKIFSFKIIENYDNRKYKGLEIKSSENEEIKKFSLGKKGIPIKYEDIIND